MVGHTLMNDVVFKIVFGAEQNEPVLRALINALLGFSGAERIVELTILNPNTLKDYREQKGAIFDIKACDGQGRQYNIEVQVASYPAYVQRVLYYLTRLFTERLDAGAGYQSLVKTIGI